MQVSPLDHGVFIWKWKHYHSLSVLETDDLLMASENDEPFLHLVTELRKMFDLTSKQGSVLKSSISDLYKVLMASPLIKQNTSNPKYLNHILSTLPNPVSLVVHTHFL